MEMSSDRGPHGSFTEHGGGCSDWATLAALVSELAAASFVFMAGVLVDA